ncbi:protein STRICTOSIDINE SYNTHASE-LIKE 11-like [Morus notabilis]|nr:protein STRICTOSIDINE SYNTHASE-LIKE 11-like [Morus notabilis]
MEFFIRKNMLFIADAFLGLFKVGLNGGLATQLANAAEGIPFRFLNGLSVDQHTGDVYFTDFSSRFLQTQIQQAVAANDSTGRLLKYDYRTKNVTVLLRRLSGANGVAISSDSSYVLVAEFLANRTRRFWLHGTKAFTSEIVATFRGMPDNIRRAPFGNFLVAVNVERPAGGPRLIPTAIRINGAGQTLQTLPLDRYYNNTTISEVLQCGKQYYIGSVEANFVGVFNG